MTPPERPESIEHRWDLLYRSYPEVYDEFASYPYEPHPLDVVGDRLGFSGRTVIDVGAGGGLSTLRLARRARRVIGVEPERAMLGVARRRAARAALVNAWFVAGDASSLPFAEGCADVVIGVTSPLDLSEARRVARAGGLLVRLEIPPGWYGGDLNEVVGHATPGLEQNHSDLVGSGFDYFDIDTVQEYGSTDRIVRTYGFIFGQRAIAHLRKTGRSSIRWKFRVYTLQVPPRSGTANR